MALLANSDTGLGKADFRQEKERVPAYLPALCILKLSFVPISHPACSPSIPSLQHPGVKGTEKLSIGKGTLLTRPREFYHLLFKAENSQDIVRPLGPILHIP